MHVKEKQHSFRLLAFFCAGFRAHWCVYVLSHMCYALRTCVRLSLFKRDQHHFEFSVYPGRNQPNHCHRCHEEGLQVPTLPGVTLPPADSTVRFHYVSMSRSRMFNVSPSRIARTLASVWAQRVTYGGSRRSAPGDFRYG